MAEFIPSILEEEAAAYQQLCTTLDGLVQRIHVDFADLSLVSNRTLLPTELPKLHPSAELDAHLMVDAPTSYFKTLADRGFTRVIVHHECQESITDIVAAASMAQLGLGLTINPQTPVEDLTDSAIYVELIQIMGVEPGSGGQTMLPETVERVKRARQLFPAMAVSVDGGVRPHNAHQLIQAGANLLVVGKGGYAVAGDIVSGVKEWQQYVS